MPFTRPCCPCRRGVLRRRPRLRPVGPAAGADRPARDQRARHRRHRVAGPRRRRRHRRRTHRRGARRRRGDRGGGGPRRPGWSTRGAGWWRPGSSTRTRTRTCRCVTDGNAQSKIRQGVTTEVIGESGSIAPQTAATAEQPWTDFTGYFGVLEKQGISVNLLSYVGLGTVRELVDRRRRPAAHADELAKMQGIVTAAMQQGAARRLDRPHLSAQRLRHARRAGRAVARRPRRSAAATPRTCATTASGCARASRRRSPSASGRRLPVHVFHIKVTGQQNFGRMKEVDRARRGGARARRAGSPPTSTPTWPAAPASPPRCRSG